MMIIMAQNRDDFAVLRSNNWLAWLTVTSRAGEVGRAPAHYERSTKTLQKPPLELSSHKKLNKYTAWLSKYPEVPQIIHNNQQFT